MVPLIYPVSANRRHFVLLFQETMRYCNKLNLFLSERSDILRMTKVCNAVVIGVESSPNQVNNPHVLTKGLVGQI